MTARGSPAEWTGAPPAIGLAWTTVAGVPFRDVDVGPFRNGLAAIVLKRELEKIEAFEKAAAERQRQFEAKQEAERQKAKAAADEAARQARLKEEAEKSRREAERLQAEQQKTPDPERPRFRRRRHAAADAARRADPSAVHSVSSRRLI